MCLVARVDLDKPPPDITCSWGEVKLGGAALLEARDEGADSPTADFVAGHQVPPDQTCR